jgi:hypothetical protein
MMRVIGIAAAAAFLGGCGSSATQPAKADETAAALTPGAYELSWSDVELQPAAAGKSETAAADLPKRACIADGGKIEPAAFVRTGNTCHAINSYVRNGIVNVQLSCTGDGAGKLSTIANGTFTAEAFDANVDSSIAGEDYKLTAKVSGKRIGECTAEQS